jgi:hypothetical protein
VARCAFAEPCGPRRGESACHRSGRADPARA